MINLLPTEEGLELKRLYRRRLAITILTLLFLLVIFSLVTLLPTFLLFSAKLGTLGLGLQEVNQRVSDQGIGDLIEIVNSVNQKTKILVDSDGFALGEILEKLVDQGRGLVSIQAINLSESGEIAISGTAQTRADFLDFLGSLETEPSFSRVDSPISNLIAVRDINFRVNLTVASSSRP